MNKDELYKMPAYHEPGKPYMSMRDRAAQFMPFKSLTDYHGLVQKEEDEILDDEWETIIYEDVP